MKWANTPSGIIYFILLLTSVPLKAQPAIDYAKIDAISGKLTKDQSKTIESVAKAISNAATNDYEKVRGVYVWISANVVYDINAYRTGNVPEQTAESTFKYKIAVCQGYSELFHKLCKLLRVESMVIAGYSKGFGYKTGKKFKSTDHAWNAVKINGQWLLIDPTWGSGFINENNDYVKSFTNEHFFTAPEKFIIKHLPADPIWQLLPVAISLAEYEKDTNYVKQLVANPKRSGISYADTLKNWEKLDSVNQVVNSNLRIIRYTPQNSEAWYKMGWFYFSEAWQRMMKLNDPATQRNRALAQPLARESIFYLQEAQKYLDKVDLKDPFYEQDVKQKKAVIKQNLANLEKIAK